MGIKFADVIVPLVLNLVHFASSRDFLPCNVSDLFPCADKEICDTGKKECVCVDGYSRDEDECVPSSEVSNSVFTAIVTIILALIMMIGALVLLTRKYNLVEYVRRKLNLPNDDDIVYEDVMIGHDVRPVTP